MTQWIDPVPSVERNTNGILMVTGTEANHWLQPHGGWCWHFHPISTAYRRQRKRNFETCLRAEREEEKTKRRNQRVSSVTFSDQQASSLDSQWRSHPTHTSPQTPQTCCRRRREINRPCGKSPCVHAFLLASVSDYVLIYFDRRDCGTQGWCRIYWQVLWTDRSAHSIIGEPELWIAIKWILLHF